MHFDTFSIQSRWYSMNFQWTFGFMNMFFFILNAMHIDIYFDTILIVFDAFSMDIWVYEYVIFYSKFDAFQYLL